MWRKRVAYLQLIEEGCMSTLGWNELRRVIRIWKVLWHTIHKLKTMFDCTSSVNVCKIRRDDIENVGLY